MKKLLPLLVLFCFALSQAQAILRPEHVVVVYNEASALSKECAEKYAQVRAIPKSHLLPLNIAVKKRDITHEEFDKLIREPLRAMAPSRKLQYAGDSRFAMYPIYAMVLMPDMPLRIKATPVEKGQKSIPWPQTDASSVDSELSLLGAVRYSRKGMRRNDYYKKDESLMGQGYPLLSVCRIDSPHPDVSRRMVSTPKQVESKGGLKGSTLVDWGGPYAAGDKTFISIAQRCVALGQQFYVQPLKTTFETAYPLPKDCSMYFGWYSQNANGPFSAGQKQPQFNFKPGAVAMHLHSFSATSISDKAAWVGPLLMKGAAVTSGNTWEPYLAGTLALDIFHDRLLKGYCVAEAALMSTPSSSWQGVVFGDPLYRPFPRVNKSVLTAESKANALFIKKKYNEALAAFVALHKAAPDEASRLRAAIGCVQSLLLLSRKQEAKELLEEIALHESKSVYIGAINQMKKHYFPPPKPQNKGEKVGK